MLGEQPSSTASVEEHRGTLQVERLHNCSCGSRGPAWGLLLQPLEQLAGVCLILSLCVIRGLQGSLLGAGGLVQNGLVLDHTVQWGTVSEDSMDAVCFKEEGHRT